MKDSRNGERLLIVRLAGIGDVAVASALIERIRAERSDTHVTFLTGRGAEPIVRLLDVDEVMVVDDDALFRGGNAARATTLAGLWARLLTRRFDRVIMLHVDARYRMLTAPLVGTRIDKLSRATHGAMNPVPGRWLGDEYARMLDGVEHVGPIERRYVMSDLRDRVPVREQAAQTVGLVPAGGRNTLRDNSLRRWPVAQYVALANLIVAQGFDVVLLGASDDRWAEEHFQGTAVRSEIGKLDLVDTLSLMRGLVLLVSHDTGPMHLARLVRTPLVALFGPTDPGQILWRDDSVALLWGGAHLACRPCYDGREYARCASNTCMSSIAPEAVFRAAMSLLEGYHR